MIGRTFLGLVVISCVWITYEVLPEERSFVNAPVPGVADSESVVSLGYVDRLQVIHASDGGRVLYGMEDHCLYVSEDRGRRFQRRGCLPKHSGGPVEVVKNIVARTKVVRSLRRNRGPENLVVLSTGTILIIYDVIYRSTDGGHRFEPVASPRALGLTGGPFPWGIGVTVDRHDRVYLGEYTTSVRPHPVRILRGTQDGTRWTIAHTFEEGKTFHVHSLQYDPYRDLIWVTTGDWDWESHVFYTRDDFRSLERLGGNSQDWRVVSLVTTADYLYWGSDDDTAKGASIFRWSFQERRLEKLVHIGKVSYHSTMLADGTLVISTTYEPKSGYVRLNNPPKTSDLWVSRDGVSWRQALSIPYDPDVMTAWGPGRAQMAFPFGTGVENLWMSPVDTIGNPFLTALVQIVD